MFESGKLAVLKNVFEFSEKALAEELKWAAKQPPARHSPEAKPMASGALTILMSEKNAAGEGLSFLRRKSANIEVHKFDYLGEEEWSRFIAEKAQEYGIKLNSPALKFLADVYQGDTWRLITELQKISSLKRGVISKDELEKLGLEITPDLREFLRDLRDYQLGERLNSLERIFSLNEPMPKVFNMLVYQWPEKLSQLATYDVLVKSGKLDYEEVILDLALSG